MAVAAELAPDAAAGQKNQRRGLRPVVVLRYLGALMAITGMGLALLFGVVPIRITVTQHSPVEQATGERGSNLTDTGQTQAEVTRVTCVPYEQFDSSSSQNPACKAKDHGRLNAALIGFLLFVAGGALWVVTHGDRAVGFSERRPFIRNSQS